MGAIFGVSAGLALEPTSASLVQSTCASIEQHSYGLWLACSYGNLNAQSHNIFDVGSYAPLSRPELYGTYIQPLCVFDDDLAQVLCECELYDGFAIASLVANSTFLEALNKPKSKVLSDSKGRASRNWAIKHFKAYR